MTEFCGMVTKHRKRWHQMIAVPWVNQYTPPINLVALCGAKGERTSIEDITLDYCQVCLRKRLQIETADKVTNRLIG